jgi:hypothetical protein
MEKEHYIYKVDRSLLDNFNMELLMGKVVLLKKMGKYKQEYGKIMY